MLPKTIVLQRAVHRGLEVLLLRFSYDRELINIAKKNGACYSKTFNAWYVPASKANLHLMFKIFKGKAWLDIDDLKKKKVRNTEQQKGSKKTIELPQLSESLHADIKRFQAWMEHRHYSPRTVSVYTMCVQQFLRFHDSPKPTEIVKKHLIDFNQGYIIQQGLSTSYQNQFVNALKLYLREMCGLPIPEEDLERPRKEKKLPNVLCKEEVQAIFRAVPNMKHRFILQMIYACGLRIGELTRLQIADIDRNRKAIHIRRSKGYKDRYIPLPESIEKILTHYLNLYAPKTYLVEGQQLGLPYSPKSVQSIIKRAAFKAGIHKPVTPHWSRHSYATHLMDSGTDTRYIQILLGHQSIKTTEIYTHVSNSQLRHINSPMDDMDI